MKLERLKKVFYSLLILLTLGFLSQKSMMVLEAATNSTYGSAIGIALNTTYSSTTQVYGENNWYKVTLPSAGKLDVIMNHDAISDSRYSSYAFKIKVYEEDGTTEYMSVDSLVGDTTTKVPSIGLAAGNYYVSVISNQSIATNYKITANFTESTAWEKEHNDSKGTANSIKNGKTYSGTIKDYADKDYYKFKLTKAGSVSVNFSHTNLKDSSYFYNVSIINSNDTVFLDIQTRGTETSKKLTSLGLPAGTYYAIVEDYIYTSTSGYKISIGYKTTTACETEHNDSFEAADSVKTNITYSGASFYSNKYDKDYYKFKLSNAGLISLTFNHADLKTAKECFTIELYNSKKKKVTELISNGKNKKKTISGLGLSKGTYYIYISAFGKGNDKAYSFKVNYKKVKNYETEDNGFYDKADSIKMGTTYKGRLIGYYDDGHDYDYYKFTVSKKCWINISVFHKSKSVNANNWSLCVSDKSKHLVTDENGNSSFIGSGKSNKRIKSGNILLKKGTYYIELYGKKANTTYYLHVSKLNMKTPAITKVVSPSKKKVNIKWNQVMGADKYLIYRSTSKNGQYKLVRTVKAGYYSFTDSSVKSGKTYYYRVRSSSSRWVKYKKQNIVSKLSSAKKVKVK